MKVSIVSVLLLVAGVFAAPGVQDNRVDIDDSTFSRAARFIGNCLESDDMTTCLAVKGITALNRAARSNNIELISGVTFARDPNTSARSGKALSEHDIVSSLPAESSERNGRLFDLATQAAIDFFGSHNLQVKVPVEATQELARSLEEGRGKLKKMMGPFSLAIIAKLVTIVPLILGGLALLTFKAVIIAKIALLLALAVGASKIFGGNKLSGLGAIGGGYNSNQWAGNSGYTSGSSYPYARSMNDDAHDIAYQGQVPQQ